MEVRGVLMGIGPWVLARGLDPFKRGLLMRGVSKTCLNALRRRNLGGMSLSTLCLECGLCCDGTLFLHVGISAAERERLVSLGIAVGTRRKHDVMWLPCGKLEGKCCTMYDARPGGCRRFVCALGQRLERKEVTLDEARAQVADMHARLGALREVLPPPEGEPVLRHARACIDSTTTPVSEVQLAAFKRVEALRYDVFMPPPQ